MLKAEALHLANRTSEALAAIAEAETVANRTEERECFAELHRLRGVFLVAVGADETQIEASFCEAIRTAQEQKSTSLAKRAEATYAEYRCRKARALGERGFPTACVLRASGSSLPFVPHSAREILFECRGSQCHPSGVRAHEWR